MPALALTNEDLLAAERELCSRSLANFVRQAWHVFEPGTEYIHGWHIDAICEHLEAVTSGEIDRLLINIPPGCMKSSLVSVFHPCWEWGPKGLPNHRFIGASYEVGLATRDTRAMRRIVQSDWFQSLWPVLFVGDQNQKTYFENEEGGWRQACAVASMTGRRGHRVIWDDPHSVEGSLSEANRLTALREFTETLPTRMLDPSTSTVTVVMQRLHEQDVSGYILEHDLGYEHLCLPMEFEAERRCSTSIGFVDPRKEDGELLFPERFPRDVVERDKNVMGSAAVAGQFQQRPSPRGGGIIHTEWWQYYSVLPEMDFFNIYADTAQKTKEANDYSVFQCWGKGKDGKLYLVDQLRGKWEAPELRRMAELFWEKHKGSSTRGFCVEDKSSGTGLIQEIKRAGGIPIKGVERSRDKYSRVMDVVSWIEAGMVVLPEKAQYLADFVHECESFTADDSHLHDDQIDPMCDAISEMLATKPKGIFEVMGKQ